MNPIDSKLKKILAMIDGATSEGEARAASLPSSDSSQRTT